MAEIGQKRRYTFLTIFAMGLASVVTVGIGLVGLALWVPNMMTAIPGRAHSANPGLLDAIFIFLSLGPVVAAGALVIGWLVFLLGRPGAGLRLNFFPPVIWAGLVLAYLAAVSAFCEGEFTCGL